MAYWGLAVVFVVAIGETVLYEYLRKKNNESRD